MSRFSALFMARKRPEDPPSAAAGAIHLHLANSDDAPRGNLEDDVFNLLPPDSPPEAAQQTSRETSQENSSAVVSLDKPQPSLKKSIDNIHQLASADFNRLSIDNDGRLYWDGKPVEVRRQLHLSPAQTMGARIVAGFLVIGAIGAAIQGSLALRDWGCRLGWSTNYCGLPDKAPSSRDIPA